MRRSVGALALVFGVVAAGLFFARRPISISALPAETGPVLREARGTGTVESSATVDLAFTVGGRVATVLVDEGQRVREGEVLATIDDAEQKRQISLAARNAAHATSAIGRSAAEVRRAEASLQAATRERDRVDTLFAAKVLSEIERDAAHDRLRLAEAELSAARASRQQSLEGASVAEESVKLHTQRGEDAILVSPMDGVVTRRLREPGDTVTAGAAVLTVASTERVRARVWMDETAMSALREGQPASVTFRGAPQRALRARVDRVSVEADRATRELLVDLELLERPERLVFGQRVDAVVELERREAALRAPREACVIEANACWVRRNDRVARAEVRFGLVGTQWVEVLEGLNTGEPLLLPSREAATLPVGRRVAVVAP